MKAVNAPWEQCWPVCPATERPDGAWTHSPWGGVGRIPGAGPVLGLLCGILISRDPGDSEKGAFRAVFMISAWSRKTCIEQNGCGILGSKYMGVFWAQFVLRKYFPPSKAVINYKPCISCCQKTNWRKQFQPAGYILYEGVQYLQYIDFCAERN